MQLVHLVARMREPFSLFRGWDHASWMWAQMQERFPAAIAACLMLNHLHVLTWVRSAIEARSRLARTCGHLQRRVGLRELFEPVPPADLVPLRRAARAARYVELNPCRGRLVVHPLSWMWTTARDAVGAAADRWVQPDLHRRAIGPWASPRSWLRYLVQDERVTDRDPLRPPLPAGGVPGGVAPRELVSAVAAALRVEPVAVRQRGPARKLVLALARDQGVRSVPALVQLTGASRATVHRGLERVVPDEWLQAARQCLADPRLISALPTATDRREKAG